MCVYHSCFWPNFPGHMLRDCVVTVLLQSPTVEGSLWVCACALCVYVLVSQLLCDIKLGMTAYLDLPLPVSQRPQRYPVEG